MINDDYTGKFSDEMPTELRIWLFKATDGIGNMGTARVAEDIRVHFESMVSGACESVGDARAIEEAVGALGDPGKANRGFRRIYLTEAEEKRLRKRFVLSSEFNFSGYVFLLIGFVLILTSIIVKDYEKTVQYYGGFRTFMPIVVANMFGLLAVAPSHRWLMQRLPRRVMYTETILYTLLYLIVFIVVPNSIFISPLFLAMIAFCIRDFRVARKLPKQLTWGETRLLLRDTELTQ